MQFEGGTAGLTSKTVAAGSGVTPRIVVLSMRNTSVRGLQMTASAIQLSVTWARSFSANNASSMSLRSTAWLRALSSGRISI